MNATNKKIFLQSLLEIRDVFADDKNAMLEIDYMVQLIKEDIDGK